MISFPGAKINLGLNVIERRPDGYHNLETIFYPVQLTDVLEIIASDHFEFHSSGIETDSDSEKNLAIKAYRLLQKAFNLPPVKIHLHKVIPPGAGLGGGSSDAAFMLKMVNSLFKTGLSQEQLEKYAAILGADCSFFITGQPVFATSKGDRMTPVTVDLSGFKILLVKPSLSVSTALAYQAIRPRRPEVSPDRIIGEPVEKWKNRLVNDFEETVFNNYPEIAALKQRIYDLGALYASMTGSGSAVYGLFHEVPQKTEAFFPASYSIFIL